MRAHTHFLRYMPLITRIDPYTQLLQPSLAAPISLGPQGVGMGPSTPSPKVIKMREVESPMANSMAFQTTFDVKRLSPNHYETTSGAIGLFHKHAASLEQTATRKHFGGHTPSDYHLRRAPDDPASPPGSPGSPGSPAGFPRLSEGTQGSIMKGPELTWQAM